MNKKLINNSSWTILFWYVCLCMIILMPFTVAAQKRTLPFDVPKDQLRIVTWNLQFLGRRTPLRTDKELKILAERIRGWGAAVIALQEIQNNKRIHELVALLGSEWKVNPEAGWNLGRTQEDETCLLWNTTKVTCVSYKAWIEGYQYTNRPPFSGIFKPVEEQGSPFVVISNHAYPGHSKDADKHRQEQGTFYRQLVLRMLKEPNHPQTIFLVGDFNGEPGHSPHTTIQPKGKPVLLNLVNKPDDKGTLTNRQGDIDHIYATNAALLRLPNVISHVIRPEDYNESPQAFNQICSDHLPVFVDMNIYASQ